MSTSIDIGFDAETQALEYLKSQGLRFECRNFKSRQGEIDLILYDHTVLVFVEVRKRKHPHYGAGLESITWHKQNRLTRTATQYLLENNQYEKINCRFDIISIDKHDEITWIKNAFELVY